MDSDESFLLNCSEGRRGGKAGDLEGLRGGILGGPVGFASWGVACPVLVMTGGGKTPLLRAPLGSLPMPLMEGDCTSKAGGFWTVCRLVSTPGLPSTMACASLGPLLTWPRCRAAIRAWIDRGSSAVASIVMNVGGYQCMVSSGIL